jgi:hypothetical protein
MMHLVLHLHRLGAHAAILHGGAVRHRVLCHGAVRNFMRQGREYQDHAGDNAAVIKYFIAGFPVFPILTIRSNE